MSKAEGKDRKIVFEDGSEFYGSSFGTVNNIVGEVVFTTSMVGYQEIVTNPAYKGKIVLFTYPIIGSYGLSDEDYESGTLTVSGIIVREYNDFPSNFRYTKTLAEAMGESGVAGIAGLDTRELTGILSKKGIMKAVLVDKDASNEVIAQLFSNNEKEVLLADVSSKKIWYSRTPNYRYNVVAIDCGISNSMIRSLKSRGCNVIIVPYDTPIEEIMSHRPQGIFISDGPGYPSDASIVEKLIKSFSDRIPILAIGFGCLALAKSFGASINQARVMHFGSNHPIRNLVTGSIEIASQNHSYTIDEESLGTTILTVTHRNIMDSTVEGITDNKQAYGIAFHPECTADDTDTSYIYDRFIADIEQLVNGKD